MHLLFIQRFFFFRLNPLLTLSISINSFQPFVTSSQGSAPRFEEMQHHSSDYNIWFHRKLGDTRDRGDNVKATTRCDVARDTGTTRANASAHSGNVYICMYYARGHCSKVNRKEIKEITESEKEINELTLSYFQSTGCLLYVFASSTASRG
jgi:hypothetical protein